jgi:hypothetical protein
MLIFIKYAVFNIIIIIILKLLHKIVFINIINKLNITAIFTKLIVAVQIY